MAKPTKENINVVLSEEQPETTEILAAAIVKISDGFSRLIKGGLNERALVVLIKDHTNQPQYAIQAVLRCLPVLKDVYCTKAKPKK